MTIMAFLHPSRQQRQQQQMLLFEPALSDLCDHQLPHRRRVHGLQLGPLHEG
ncbi:uncharacterized protein BDV17DRAFT_248511 [Aspergillus undulatus]|uniref:uncharacterized protein n=1 Tax=Aspergillus undulatus TaxID=1810928 RepID=UPI003CCE50A6